MTARNRWGTVAAFALVAACTQMLWLTYAPITTGTAGRYGVSVGAVGWLANIFPLMYVVLAIPSGHALDRWFTAALLAGAGLTALGGLLRLGGMTFGWALAGQVAVAIAQPLVLNAVTKVPRACLEESARPLGIAVGSAGTFAGIVLALVLGPALGGSDHLTRVLTVQAGLAVVAAVLLASGLVRAAVRPDPTSGAAPAAGGLGALRAVWALPVVRTVAGAAFLGFGIFVAITTWLQTLLEPRGVTSSGAGGLLLVMVTAGVIASTALPATVARRGAERTLLIATLVATAGACVVLGLARSIVADGVALAAAGALLLAALPVLLTILEDRCPPEVGGSATAVMWMAGNAGGLVMALAVQAVVGRPLVAFLMMASIALAGLPVPRRLAAHLAGTATSPARVP